MVKCKGGWTGGREGLNAHPHLPKKYFSLEFFFSKFLVALPQKHIMGKLFFKIISFHNSRGSFTIVSIVFSKLGLQLGIQKGKNEVEDD
jgi:hypothetical protein